MTKYSSQSLVSQGVDTCPGCGLELAIRSVFDVLGDNVVVIIPPGCAALFSGFGNRTALKVPGFQGNLANTAAYAAGVKSGFEIQGKIDIRVLAFAGDGATADIGIQALSGVFERGDNIIYVCYDNEAYMNTGIQSSGSTPFKAKTTTTPKGKLSCKKDMIRIAAAHNIPYIPLSLPFATTLGGTCTNGWFVLSPPRNAPAAASPTLPVIWRSPWHTCGRAPGDP